MEEQKQNIPVGELLTRPAEEFVNDPSIEMAWMDAAVRHMEAYYRLITSVPLDQFHLTRHDDEIFETFKQRFPDLDVKVLTEEMIKSQDAKVKWRQFCMDMENKIEDFNFATLIRLNSESYYSEDNTIVVPRAQFIAIEIARNRLGYNINLPPVPLE